MAKVKRSSKKAATPAATPSRTSKRAQQKEVSYVEEHEDVDDFEVVEKKVVVSTPKKGRTSSRAAPAPAVPDASDSEHENGNAAGSDEEDAAADKKPAPKSKKGRGRPKSMGTLKPKSKQGPAKRAASSGGSSSAKKTKADSDESDDDEEYEVEKILDVHFLKGGKREFYIKWKGWSINDASWEPEEHLQCKELLDAFIAKVDDLKEHSHEHELRVARQQTQRYADANRNPGVRTSRRFSSKARQTYHGLED